MKAFNAYYKFCFVRNPFDRIVSSYIYLKQGGIDGKITPWIKNHILPFKCFSEFVKYSLPSNKVKNEQHFRPQYKFICDKNFKIKVDFVGRFENLETDLRIVAKKININCSLPMRNLSKRRKDYRKYYDNETYEIIADFYQKDIDLFGYGFDNITKL